MSLLNNFSAWLRREPTAARMEQLKKEITHDLRQNLLTEPDEWLGWRAMLGKMLSNDITPRQREMIIKTSRELVKRDPTAKRAMQIPIEAIEAAGYTVQADDKDVEAYLSKFLVKWEEKMSLLYLDRLINGELCVPIMLNPVNGYPQFGYIDSLAIEAVEYSPLDALEPEYVVLRRGTETQRIKVFQFTEDADGYESYDGGCFFWPNFPMMGMSRGLPELSAEIDYIQLFEKAMRSETARFAELRSFIWHFIHEGKDDVYLTDWTNKNFPDGKPPGPASFFATNEKVKIEAISPSLQSADAADAAEMIGQHIFAGLGFPTFYFGKGENTNVATAREIAIPTTWKLKRHQKQDRRMRTDICKLFYTASINAGVVYNGEFLPRLRCDQWSIVSGEIYPRDMVQGAQVFGQLMSTVATAKSNGMLPEQVQNEIICVGLRELGIEKNPSELAKMFEDEDLERDAEEATKRLISGLPGTNGHANGEMEKPSYAEMIRMGMNPYATKKPPKTRRRF